MGIVVPVLAISSSKVATTGNKKEKQESTGCCHAVVSATWNSTVAITRKEKAFNRSNNQLALNQKGRKHFNKSNNQPVFCRCKEVAAATNSSKMATS